MKTLSAAVALTALLGACATPESKTAGTQTADASKQICKRVSVTGSRASERECHTQAEWNAIALNQNDAARQARENSRQNGSGQPGEPAQ
jgi:hypothetical protein